MKRDVLRAGLCVGTVLFSLHALAEGPSLFERLGKLLGLDKTSVARVSKPRGADAASCSRPREGMVLLKQDCAARTESVLWRCDGCWSPVQAGDAGVAVLRADGLWLVEAPDKARPLVEGQGFISLLGFSAEGGGTLTVLRERPEGGIPLLGRVEVTKGTFSEAPLQPATREEGNGLRNVQPAALQDTRLLSTVEKGRGRCGPREVRVEKNRGQAKALLCESRSVPDSGTWDRFDPAWSGEGAVYVARPAD